MKPEKHAVVPGRLLLLFLLLVMFSAQAQDFYWRGATGRWSDPSNWESTYGGIPTASDNVIFDENSFSANGQTITIDQDAECLNMDWTGIDVLPRLAGDNSLAVYGSIRLKEGIKIEFTGDIYLKAEGNENQIDFAGNTLSSNLFFNGDGQWNFVNDVDVGESEVSLEKGVIDTKGKTLVCGSFVSTGQNPRTLKLNASLVRITGLDGRWMVNNSLALQKGTARIVFQNPDPHSQSVFRGGSLAYYRLESFNSLEILGNNAFDFLKLNPGITCKLESGKTQTVRQGFSARGCAGLIYLEATDSQSATIRKINGDISLSFVALQFISASMESGGTFNANNSIDLGNNQGINISNNSREMHWKNGTGLWSDTLHWNATANGADAKCVPLPFDDVVFDANSFSGADTVKVDLIEAHCNNFFWNATENAVLVNLYDSSRLTVSGSLKFALQMQNMYTGEFSFNSTEGDQVLKSNGVAFAGDVRFSGENGNWELRDALQVEGTINFEQGTLTTKNNPVYTSRFLSGTELPRTLNMGKSLLQISKTAVEPGLLLNNKNLVFNQTKLRIQMKSSDAAMHVYGGDTLRFYQVDFINPNASASIGNDSTYSKFQKLSFAGNGEILGNNMFDTISLSKACVYMLQAGKIQTINRKIIAPGSCEGTLLLKSSKNGKKAKINKPSGTLRLDHVSLRDIAAIAPATYIARNAIDLGNNSGWTEITGPEERELFWVGGNGDWNDVNHWSLSSGGSGGECVPTPQDVVHLDKNSFSVMGKTLTVDRANAFARDLIWSNDVSNPIFLTTNITSLRVFGSMELSDKMKFVFNGPIYFEASEPGQTIKTNGIKLQLLENSIYFDGVGGEWTLLDDLDLGQSDTMRNSIYLYNGTLITNDHSITCYNFNSNSNTARTLSLGSSDLNVYNSWIVNGKNLTLYESDSRLLIETGLFNQKLAGKVHYNDVIFKSEERNQKLLVTGSDTVEFRRLIFNKGELSGADSHVLAEEIRFNSSGTINNDDSAGMNVYSIGKLVFAGSGKVFGNDTIGEIRFDSTGLIQGNGVYGKVYFSNDGQILGSNRFGTLDFSPAFIYELEGGQLQTITDDFNIRGNNCESIWLQSTNALQAEIFKETDSVKGEFIEMSNINAGGGAVFDAGYFSTDVNTSNAGWLFHPNPMKYRLDTNLADVGDTLIICADNFNGGAGATYIWQKYPDGDTVSTDYCMILPPYEMGYYTLTVNYAEGAGCVRYDTLLWGCFYSLQIDKSDASCYGYNDGSVYLDIQEGTGGGPYSVKWYAGDELLSSGQSVDSLPRGIYSYSVTDGNGCTSYGELTVDEPDSLALNFEVNYNESIIDLWVEGGVEPYLYLWETGSDGDYTSFQEVGEYPVIVTDANNCTKSGTVYVDNRFNILAPNAFTPNGDGLNDYFDLYWQGPEMMNYRIDIFGRWGNLVFTSDNFDNRWNGRVNNNGDLLPQSTYSWRVVVVSYDGKQTASYGTVTLLR